MRVALYLRRSTVDLQPDSLATQEEILRSYAAAGGHDVVRIYSDSASGRSVQGREGFARLIDQVKTGADFDAVLVRDVTRWSRADDTDEAGYYEFLCRSRGVQVVYVEECFGDGESPYGLLMKSIKRTMAAEFSREKGRLASAGQIRAAERGFWSGPAPYGMGRVLIGEDGSFLAELANGDRKTISSARVKLRPGSPNEVAVVLRIFDSYVQGRAPQAIARDLNDERVPTRMGRLWGASGVCRVLRNEAYAGNVVRWPRRRPGSPARPDVVRCSEAHEPVIGKQQWQAAQERLRVTGGRRGDIDLAKILNAARRTWRQRVERERETPGRDLREGYESRDTEIIDTALAKVRESIVEALAIHFDVESYHRGWIIDRRLYVGCSPSLPHFIRGSLRWIFRPDASPREDVVLGIGFSPPPRVAHVETFFFRLIPSRTSGWRPIVATSAGGGHYSKISCVPKLAGRLRASLRKSGHWAEDRLLEALASKEHPTIDFLANSLGWSVGFTRYTYKRVRRVREDVKSASCRRPWREIRVTCPRCGRTRTYSRVGAAGLESDWCAQCSSSANDRRTK